MRAKDKEVTEKHNQKMKGAFPTPSPPFHQVECMCFAGFLNKEKVDLAKD